MADLAGTENRKGIQRKTKNTPPPPREKTPCHRSIPEIAVRFQPSRKTSQLLAEPEEWPKR